MSSVTFRFLRESRIALATSNWFPLSRGYKFRLRAREDTLPDAGGRFRIDTCRDLYEVNPRNMYLFQSQRTGG